MLEGTGRLRVDDETLTVPKYGGAPVGPERLRQVFNDTDAEVLWLIVGAPVEACYTEGQPHGFFNHSPWLEKTTKQMDDFLVQIGYLAKEPVVPLPSRSGSGER